MTWRAFRNGADRPRGGDRHCVGAGADAVPDADSAGHSGAAAGQAAATGTLIRR